VDERTLVGGRTVGAVRVGESVRKPSQPWTPAVHAVLRHLESAGLDGAPRSGGVDEHGRQVLSFLTGETVGEQRPWPAWVWADATLAQVGAWLRRLHDVTTTFRPPEGAVWFAGQSWRPDLIIGHHDAAPYNAVWLDGRLVGFADWDTAGPSTRELDLAYAALWWVPLHARHVVAPLGFTRFDDRARRLDLLLDAYGYDGDRVAFRGAVAHRARVNASVIRRRAEGDPVYRALLTQAEDLEQAALEVERDSATAGQDGL
jgi:hypothetical protein